MKALTRNSAHENYRSHDCLLLEHNGKKIKITYEAHNAVERCNTDFFDGDKWNHIFSLSDLGETPESSAYNIWDNETRQKRADDLLMKSKKMCESILN